MPTRIKTLFEVDKKSHANLHSFCQSVFLDGECYAFATALHRGLGWTMFGIMNGDEIRHAVILSPDGKLYDARGHVFEEELGEPFNLRHPLTLKLVNESDLMREDEPSEVRENTIRRARKIAEVLWPELPWKDNFSSRVSLFANELETLSRKHGFWIRSPVPASLPMIAVSDGEEGGYNLSPTIDGVTFTIDRYF